MCSTLILMHCGLQHQAMQTVSPATKMAPPQSCFLSTLTSRTQLLEVALQQQSPQSRQGVETSFLLHKYYTVDSLEMQTCRRASPEEAASLVLSGAAPPAYDINLHGGTRRTSSSCFLSSRASLPLQQPRTTPMVVKHVRNKA